MQLNAVALLALLIAVTGEGDSARAENGQPYPFVNPQVGAATNIHFNKLYCSECHLKTPAAGKKYLRFDNYTATCRCHGYTPDNYTHPVDITPSPERRAGIPSDFPLEQGKITCNTCHAIVLQCDPVQGKTNNGKFLRVDSLLSRTAICYQCHDERKHKMLDPHNQLDPAGKIVAEKCLYCHTEKPDENLASYQHPESQGRGVQLIGDLSVLCYRCHYKKSRLHPINANHLVKPSERTRASMRKNERRLGIVLPLDDKGRITCVTCHNPHERGVIPQERAEARGAGEKGRLRITAVADRICLVCHMNK